MSVALDYKPGVTLAENNAENKCTVPFSGVEARQKRVLTICLMRDFIFRSESKQTLVKTPKFRCQ